MAPTDARTSVADSKVSGGNWLAVGSYAAVGAVTQLLWLTYAPVTTSAAAFYSVGEGYIGVLSIIFPLVYVVLALPCGLLLDRWFRPVLIVGGLLTAAGALLRVVDTTSITWATVGQVVIAIGQPFVLGAITKVCVDYLPRRSRPTGIAVGTAGLFVGMLIAFVTGALLEDNISELLMLQAALAVVAVLAMCIVLIRPGRFADEIEVAAGVSVDSTRRHPLRTVWSDPALRLLIAIVAVGFGVFVALTTWLQALLEPAGVTATTSAVILLVMVVAGIFGAALLPPIAARRGNQVTFMFIALGAAIIGCLALAIAPSAVTGYVVAGALGFLLLSVLPIVLEMVEARAGAAVSTATSAVWLAGNAGGVLVSGLIGVFLGMPAIGFALMALVPLVFGLPLVVRLRRTIRTSA
jgi:predicted MFS family arabinose efflux permease